METVVLISTLVTDRGGRAYHFDGNDRVVDAGTFHRDYHDGPLRNNRVVPNPDLPSWCSPPADICDAGATLERGAQTGKTRR